MIPENTHRRTLLTAAAGVFAADDRICIGVIGGGGRGDSLCRDIAKNQNEVRTRPRSHVPRPQAADRKKTVSCFDRDQQSIRRSIVLSYRTHFALTRRIDR